MQPWQADLLLHIVNQASDGQHISFIHQGGRRNGMAKVRKVGEYALNEIRGVHAGPAILDETTVLTDEQVAALEFLKDNPPKFPSYEESFVTTAFQGPDWKPVHPKVISASYDPVANTSTVELDLTNYTSLLRDEIAEAAEKEMNRQWWHEFLHGSEPEPKDDKWRHWRHPSSEIHQRDEGSNIRASWNYVKHRYGSIEEYYKLNWESSMAKKNKTYTEDLSDPKPIPSVGDLSTLYATEPSVLAGPGGSIQGPGPDGVRVSGPRSLRERLTNQKKELRRLNKAIQHLSLQDIVNRSRVKTLRAATVTQHDELCRKNREIQVLRAERIAAEKYAGEQEAKRKDEKRKRKQAERSLELLKADINTP
jgi:hypothetical protein